MNTRENATETCYVLWLVLCGVNSVSVLLEAVSVRSRSPASDSTRQTGARKMNVRIRSKVKSFRHSMGELGVTAALVGRTALPSFGIGLTDGKSSWDPGLWFTEGGLWLGCARLCGIGSSWKCRSVHSSVKRH